jgi:hypothetical protein
MRVESGRYGFNSLWTSVEILLCVTVAKITTHSAHFHPDQILIVTMNVMRQATRVDGGLHGGLKRIAAV